MKCKIHGYEHHKDCKYCTDSKKWVDDDYIIKKEKSTKVVRNKYGGSVKRRENRR